MITQSFPQSPQVFPQGFSTGGACCGYAVLVHIKRSDTLRRISHFSAGRGFYHEHFFVQKLGLDNSPRRPRRPPTGAGWPGRSFLRPERQKILKKGLILSRQGVIMRICMENEQKEVESMPNIKSSKKDVISSKIAYEKNKADKSELKPWCPVTRLPPTLLTRPPSRPSIRLSTRVSCTRTTLPGRRAA